MWQKCLQAFLINRGEEMQGDKSASRKEFAGSHRALHGVKMACSKINKALRSLFAWRYDDLVCNS